MTTLMIGPAQIFVILILIKVLSIVFCVNRAKKLNRDKLGWGIFAFFLDIIAVIVMLFMKPKTN